MEALKLAVEGLNVERKILATEMTNSRDSQKRMQLNWRLREIDTHIAHLLSQEKPAP